MVLIQKKQNKQLKKDYYKISFRGRFLNFPVTKWSIIQINETFGSLPYECMDVKGKIVIDLGSNIGDTAVFFVAQGAKHVYGFDCDSEAIKASLETIKINNIEDKVTIIQLKVENLKDCFALVREDISSEHFALKMDIEGGETNIFRNDQEQGKDGMMKLFDQVVMEYHLDPYPFMKALHDLGFLEVKRYSSSIDTKPGDILGMIYSGVKHELETF